MGVEAEIQCFVELGSTLAGKYRVERVIGIGGMGVVVAAQHVRLREPVAIKFLMPDLLRRERQVARFLREARAASRIKSPHVVRVYDVDVRSDGVPYLVMEYLVGGTLSHLLKSQGQLTPARTVDLILEGCEAIAEAHALGIVHRDLKPANWFLALGAGELETVKILDFGISKFVAAEDSLDATTGAGLLGSPPYMSPEQLSRPELVDARSDIWSLGVMLYRCLAGVLPFPGASVAEISVQVLRNQPIALGNLCAAAAPGLVDAVARCLTTDASARYGSVLELGRALVPYGTERATRALAVIEAVSRLDTRIKTSPTKSDAEALPYTLSAGGSTGARATHASNQPRARTKLWAGVVLAAAGVVLGRHFFAERGGSWAHSPGRRGQAASAPAERSATLAPAPTTSASVLASPSAASGADAASSLVPRGQPPSSARRRERRRALSAPRSTAEPAVSVTSTPERDPVYDQRK